MNVKHQFKKTKKHPRVASIIKKLREEDDYQGGIFSDSEVGGESRNQQNPWQGSQEKWQQP